MQKIRVLLFSLLVLCMFIKSGIAANYDGVHLGVAIDAGITKIEKMIDYNNLVAITTTTSLTATASGKHHICTGTTTDYIITLPSTGLNVGDLISFEMSEALIKLVTLDVGAGIEIDGQQTRIMWAKEVALLKWDGSNWSKLSGKSIPMNGRLILGTNQIVPTSITTKVLVDTSFPANQILNNSFGNNLITKRKGLYDITGSIRFSGLGGIAQNLVVELYINSVLQGNRYSYSPNDGCTISMGIQGLLIDKNQSIELHAIQWSGGNLTLLTIEKLNGCYLEVVEIVTW